MTRDKISQTQALRDELAALRQEIRLLQQELAQAHAVAAEALRLAREADVMATPLQKRLMASKQTRKSTPTGKKTRG
jgi:hypothetical protein